MLQRRRRAISEHSVSLKWDLVLNVELESWFGHQ
jgi:hypothetical protein